MNEHKHITKPLSVLLAAMIGLMCLIPRGLSAQGKATDAMVRERIRCIEEMLRQDQKGTDRWWYGWLTGYSAATVAQGVIFSGSDDPRIRQDMALGAATTFLGAAGQLIAPLHPGHKADQLSRMPESTPQEQLTKLATAEDWLEQSALLEKKGKSWKNHVLYGAVNLSSGLITWLGFKRTIWDGIGNFALNTAISEIQIWTQPTRSLQNSREYKNQYPTGMIDMTAKQKPVFYIGACPAGVGLRMVF